MLQATQSSIVGKAGNVSRLMAGAAKHLRSAVVAGILYFNLRFKPVSQSMTASELAMDLKEVRWGTQAANLTQISVTTPYTT